MKKLITLVGLVCALPIFYALVASMVGRFNTKGVPTAATEVVNMAPMVFTIAVGAAMCMAVLGFFKLANYVRLKRWNDYGNRLKAAYTAKFGGANSGFNAEVDQRIAIMKALSKGASKSLAEDWLKRMAKFVEIAWAIPEEEHLAEVDKTRSFGDSAIEEDED